MCSFSSTGKTKRFQLPFMSDLMPSSWNGVLPEENAFLQTQLSGGEGTLSSNPNQMTSPETSLTGQDQFISPQAMPVVPNEMFDDAVNRDQLSSKNLAFLQGQYNSPHNPQSVDKVDYFEPNESQETPPYLDSTYADTGPSKEDLKRIQPLLDSENDIANAIIKDTWREGRPNLRYFFGGERGYIRNLKVKC